LDSILILPKFKHYLVLTMAKKCAIMIIVSLKQNILKHIYQKTVIEW